MKDLSVLIPARREMFLNRTVENVLSKIRADSEVIVILDGEWPEEPLTKHDRLNVIYHPVSIGQRAAINEAAKLSQAEFILKLDAHCTVDKGFDVKLIKSAKELGHEVTQIPKQFNLYGFDWVCPEGHRRYQSPSGPCKECGKKTTRDIIFKPRWNRLTTRWRFDREMKFQYWGTNEKGPYIETMSLLGACWFLDREWYWNLGGLDEKHGSWGQMGTEIACKTWLSGGRLLTNTNTWFSHLFRTQGGDFGFPYAIDGNQQKHAERYSRDLWLNNKWPRAKHSLDWLINKFHPPGW